MPEIESQMVLMRTKELGKEFGLDSRVVAKLLKSIGAKKWRTGTHHGGGSIYYWDEQYDDKMRIKLLETLNEYKKRITGDE